MLPAWQQRMLQEGQGGRTEATDGRMYPHPTHLAVWEDFVENVLHHRESKRKIKNVHPKELEVFQQMILASEEAPGCRSETQEVDFILRGLRYLASAKIVGEILRETGTLGKPDFTLKDKDGNIGIVAEGKSTHNLLISHDAATFVRKYQQAYQTVIEQGDNRTVEWEHIAHPFAQLFGYLVDNDHRYGALTSATRTIFVYISGTESDIKVNISDPYYLGEENYLRAWAHAHSLGCRSRSLGSFNCPEDWIRTSKQSPTPQPSRRKPLAGKRKQSGEKNKNKSKKQKGHSSAKRGKCASLSKVCVPTVDFQDLVVGKEIGIGRNGSLFRVSWKGKEYAMKQFDVGKDGIQGYENEITAYGRTKKVWGELVPKPYFVSETPSGGVRLLGLQLGSPIDDSFVDANDIWELWQQSHTILENDYGIRHNEASSGQNSILIEDGHGQQRLAIIDFESWDDL